MSQTPPQHRARKRFGQNFLHDVTVIERILHAIMPQADEHLVEIGPGQGALTAGLVGSGCQLDVIELDRDLLPGLLATHGLKANFKAHSHDALKFDYAALAAQHAGQPLRVVGNLPYNISTPLIFKLLDNTAIITDMHFMLQKEVVLRLAAQPGSKLWGRLGIMAQFLCAVDHLFDVPPEAFRPQPKVESAIVRLTPYQQSPHPECEAAKLAAVVKQAFSQRRKTLRNNLKAIIDSTALESLNIDPGARAETLTLAQFVEIANAVHD